MAEGLKSASSVLQEFKRILTSSFGPNGKDVLLKSETGTYYLSKDGDFILRHFELKHPIARLVKETINYFVICTGDFSKTFIIVLSVLCRLLVQRCFDTESNCTGDKTCHKLSNISLFLLKMKTHLEENLSKHNVFKVVSLKEFSNENYLEKLLDTLYVGALNTPAKQTFIRLITCVINQDFDYSLLSYLDTHFDKLCIPVHGLPLNCSEIINGCIVQRESKPSEFCIEECANFLIISCDAGQTKQNMYQFTLSSLTQNKINFDERKIWTKIVHILQKKRIRVLFVEQTLPNKLESILVHSNIIIVSHVLEEDINWLNFLYGVSVLSGVFDILNLDEGPNTIGQPLFIKSKIVGRSQVCHIGPTKQPKSTTRNIQILLCSKTQGLQMQYQRILHNSFKALNCAFEQKPKEFNLVAAGGAFECCVVKIVKTYQRNSIDKFEKEICQILVNSFLEVINTLHINSSKKTPRKHLIELYNDDTLVDKCIDVTTGRLMVTSEMDFYEPTKSKMRLLSTLLEFAAQLVKIQYVIPSVKNIRKNVDEDEDEDIS